MSFISYPSGGGTSTTTSVSTPNALPLTSSGPIVVVDERHLTHIPTLGGMLLDLSATAPLDLVLNMTAQGRYLLNSIVFHDLRGTPGTKAVTIRTLDVARGGGNILVNNQSLASLSDRSALISVAQTPNVIWEAPHLYITLTGTGSGSVLIRALGTVLVPEDPENPMSDRRRLG